MKQKPKKHSKTAIEYQQQISELTNALQRLQAEFENYKRREAAQKAELMESSKEAVLTELLPALDNFDLAATHLPENLADNAWAQGMQYVGNQLTQKLEEMDIKKLNPIGEKFDPNRDEAVEHTQSDKPEGIITDVITPGYQIEDRVIRPARVKVSNGNNFKKANK